MKVVIVGFGGMGNTHYNVLKQMDDVEIIALVDVEESRLTEKVNETGVRTYTDIRVMLENEKPDFVEICTPSYLHCEQSVAVMEKGIHVLSEKPAALNADDVKKIYKCAAENNVMYMTAHVLRFWPEFAWLKEALDSGRYGKLINLNMWRPSGKPLYTWQNWMLDKEKSGLVPFDLHIHDIDFMIYLLGSPRETSYFQEIGTHGHYVNTICRYENGTRVEASASWLTGKVPFKMGYEAIFEHAYADFCQDKLALYANGNEAEYPVDEIVLEGSDINVTNVNAYYKEVRYFMDCLKQNKKPSIITEEELLSAVSLLSHY